MDTTSMHCVINTLSGSRLFFILVRTLVNILPYLQKSERLRMLSHCTQLYHLQLGEMGWTQI